MATHSSTLAWRIPWTEEPGGFSSWGRKESDTTEWLTCARARTHTHAHTHTHTHIMFKNILMDLLSELVLNFVSVLESFDNMMTATAGINIRVYKAHPLQALTMISNDSWTPSILFMIYGLQVLV